MSVNRAIILGNLGKPPELKRMQNGTSVCNFSIATTEKYAGKDGTPAKESTEWHNIVVWGKLGETCEMYLKKGSKVYIEGRITTRSWEKDGDKKYMTEIVASNVQFLDAKEMTANDYGKIQIEKQWGAQSKPAGAMTSNYARSSMPLSNDDIPF